MSKYTIKQLIASSNIDATLIRSTVRQAGGWTEFQEMAKDVCNNGADCGFSGFIYYYDTAPFAKRNKKAILSLCDSMAYELDAESVYDFIAGFKCFRGEFSYDHVCGILVNGKYPEDEKTALYNGLAWFALEEVCRAYVQMTEE